MGNRHAGPGVWAAKASVQVERCSAVTIPDHLTSRVITEAGEEVLRRSSLPSLLVPARRTRASSAKK